MALLGPWTLVLHCLVGFELSLLSYKEWRDFYAPSGLRMCILQSFQKCQRYSGQKCDQEGICWMEGPITKIQTPWAFLRRESWSDVQLRGLSNLDISRFSSQLPLVCPSWAKALLPVILANENQSCCLRFGESRLVCVTTHAELKVLFISIINTDSSTGYLFFLLNTDNSSTRSSLFSHRLLSISTHSQKSGYISRWATLPEDVWGNAAGEAASFLSVLRKGPGLGRGLAVRPPQV